MRFYLNQTVWDAALERIAYLFDEFPNVVVNFSGGKDSTVILNLALIVAAEKERLPLRVDFIDQEAEWQATIDYVRQISQNPALDFRWYQMPIKIFNATSSKDDWLQCWEPGAAWMREKEPDSIHDNVYGTDRFADLFEAILTHDYRNQKACNIAGVRTEESPARLKGLTTWPTYKWITWGKKEDVKQGHYTFYPIYDWSYTDVWKAIHSNGWPYCSLYDLYYQYGLPVQNMRVSNVHHETAVRSLFSLHEIEGETWSKLVERVEGVNTAKHLQNAMFAPKELPFMFETWKEYRDYLLENLIEDEKIKNTMRTRFAAHDGRYISEVQEKLNKSEVRMILINDYHDTKYTTFHASHGKDAIKYRIERGIPLHGHIGNWHVE